MDSLVLEECVKNMAYHRVLYSLPFSSNCSFSTAGIKGDIKKKLTVLCLFIDFEKAFDSVWKKGLVVKLWNAGVHGCYLKTIDSFLFGRTVSLVINGFIGPRRMCQEYGLPQGSVLSPILFKLFILD